MQRVIFIFAIVAFLLEFYVYQAFKTVFAQPWMRIAYWAATLLAYCYFFYNLSGFSRGERDQHRLQIITVLMMVFMVPKIIAATTLLTEDIFRLARYVGSSFQGAAYMPDRRKFFSIAALGLGGALSMLMLDGVIFGKYRHFVRKVKIRIKNLPESFKGYRIIQISDVHSGSFFHPEKLRHAIDLINKQDADLVLFTGDMVNNVAEEFEPFVALFKEIRAKDGKFAVLGNHDYGDYVNWESADKKGQNLQKLIRLEKEAGFTMLRNQNVAISKNGQALYIIGVENWGLPPFPQYGDLDRALAGVPQDAAKILMSHDPTHFDYVVKQHPADISLTLSGHTHGMQFGIDTKKFRWSPVKYRYKKWADLYESMGKYLYVNRGFGVLAYPGRVGIDPEITVFELG